MLNGLRISVLRGYPCLGGRRDMEVGVSILYPAQPPVPESVFPEGRGITACLRPRVRARVNHPVPVRGKAVRACTTRGCAVYIPRAECAVSPACVCVCVGCTPLGGGKWVWCGGDVVEKWNRIGGKIARCDSPSTPPYSTPLLPSSLAS